MSKEEKWWRQSSGSDVCKKCVTALINNKLKKLGLKNFKKVNWNDLYKNPTAQLPHCLPLLAHSNIKNLSSSEDLPEDQDLSDDSTQENSIEIHENEEKQSEIIENETNINQLNDIIESDINNLLTNESDIQKPLNNNNLESNEQNLSKQVNVNNLQQHSDDIQAQKPSNINNLEHDQDNNLNNDKNKNQN